MVGWPSQRSQRSFADVARGFPSIPSIYHDINTIYNPTIQANTIHQLAAYHQGIAVALSYVANNFLSSNHCSITSTDVPLASVISAPHDHTFPLPPYGQRRPIIRRPKQPTTPPPSQPASNNTIIKPTIIPTPIITVSPPPITKASITTTRVTPTAPGPTGVKQIAIGRTKIAIATDSIQKYVSDGLLDAQHCRRFLEQLRDPFWDVEDVMAACQAHIEFSKTSKKTMASSSPPGSSLIKRQRYGQHNND